MRRALQLSRCNRRQVFRMQQSYSSRTMPCAHTRLQVRQHRTIPRPWTHTSYHSYQVRKNLRCQVLTYGCEILTVVDTKTHETYKRQSHVDGKRTYTNWSKLVRVQRLAVVAVAETRCWYCGNESVPPIIERRMTEETRQGL